MREEAGGRGARHAVYVTEKGDNFVRVCDEMGIPPKHRKLFYFWLGKDFSATARRAPDGYFGRRFLSPWEGERRRAAMPTGTTIPAPEGASWGKSHFCDSDISNTATPRFNSRPSISWADLVDSSDAGGHD